MNFFKNGETQLNSMLFITELFKYTFMIQQWADAYYELIKKLKFLSRCIHWLAMLIMYMALGYLLCNTHYIDQLEWEVDAFWSKNDGSFFAKKCTRLTHQPIRHDNPPSHSGSSRNPGCFWRRVSAGSRVLAFDVILILLASW